MGKRERGFSLSKCEFKTQAFWQCVQNWILNDIAGKLTLNLRRNIKIFMEKEIQIFTCPSNAIMVWSFEPRGLYAIDSLYDYNLTAAAACFWDFHATQDHYTTILAHCQCHSGPCNTMPCNVQVEITNMRYGTMLLIRIMIANGQWCELCW